MNLKFSAPNVFILIVLVGVFAMAARNATDPDLWWHLKTGQYILEQGSVPHADPFSYTRAGQPWVAHEWLTEVLLYEIERLMGWGGLIVTFAAITCAAFFLLYLRCGKTSYLAGIATLAAAWATIPVWGVRPQVVSLLLTSLWLLILERSDRNARLLWCTVPLMLLWVNLHAGFAMGLALSALFLAGNWLERTPEAWQHSSPVRLGLFVFIADLLVVPLNPNGVRMFSYPLETLRSPVMQRYIAEWASPNFHRVEYFPFLLIVLATFAQLSGRKSRARARDLILLVTGLYLGLCSIRLTPLFILVAVPFLARQTPDWPVKFSRQRITPPRAVFHTAITLGMILFAAIHTRQVIQRQPQAEIEHFPAGAVAYLQAHSSLPSESSDLSSGRVFNHYDWGGYLIWRLYPGTQVFIDGRADVYGTQLFEEFADTYQFKDGWQRILQEFKVKTILVPRESALATGLRDSGDWTVSYEDSQAIILTKRPDSLRAKRPPRPRSGKAIASARIPKASLVTVDMQEITVCKKLHL